MFIAMFFNFQHVRRYRQLVNDNLYFNINNILQDINIMSTSPSFCGMCDNRHISKPSEGWFRDCEEGLCTESNSFNHFFNQMLGLIEHN
jgi:hypothetical protein